MSKDYLRMGTSNELDFFAPYDEMAMNDNFKDGFEFAIRAIYPEGRNKQLFTKGGTVHEILTAGMIQYGKTHTQEEVKMFRIGGGVACLVSTAHETWSAKERKDMSEYALDMVTNFVCDQVRAGSDIPTDPEVLKDQYKTSIKTEIRNTLN